MTIRDHFRWILPVSLLLNAFALGAFVGRLGEPHFGPDHGPPPPPELERRMSDGMDQPDAEIVRKTFADAATAMAASHADLAEARQRIRAALEAQPFDAAALQRALDLVQAAHTAADTAMSAAFVKAASELSPDGRRRLAAHNPGPGPGGGAPPPGPPPDDPGADERPRPPG